MISLLDIAERSQKGRKMAEDSWNMSLFNKISELVKRYGIPNYTSDTSFLNLDDELTERVFHAGVDLLVEHGVYCITTGRIIELTRKEVLDAINESPSEIIVGGGKTLG